jgi:hypothetical protein
MKKLEYFKNNGQRSIVLLRTKEYVWYVICKQLDFNKCSEKFKEQKVASLVQAQQA